MEQLTHLLISNFYIKNEQETDYRDEERTILTNKRWMDTKTYVETLYDHFYLERLNNVNKNIKLI